jgi:hypothetical protein
VKSNPEKKTLTLGGLIHSGFRVSGARRATALIRLGARARLILFQEPVSLHDFLKK